MIRWVVGIDGRQRTELGKVAPLSPIINPSDLICFLPAGEGNTPSEDRTDANRETNGECAIS
jgi:hypothetical protein